MTTFEELAKGAESRGGHPSSINHPKQPLALRKPKFFQHQSIMTQSSKQPRTSPPRIAVTTKNSNTLPPVILPTPNSSARTSPVDTCRMLTEHPNWRQEQQQQRIIPRDANFHVGDYVLFRDAETLGYGLIERFMVNMAYVRLVLLMPGAETKATFREWDFVSTGSILLIPISSFVKTVYSPNPVEIRRDALSVSSLLNSEM